MKWAIFTDLLTSKNLLIEWSSRVNRNYKRFVLPFLNRSYNWNFIQWIYMKLSMSCRQSDRKWENFPIYKQLGYLVRGNLVLLENMSFKRFIARLVVRKLVRYVVQPWYQLLNTSFTLLLSIYVITYFYNSI